MRNRRISLAKQTLGVVLTERHDHELRPGSGLLGLVQFADEVIDAFVVAVDEGLLWPVGGDMAQQRALEIHLGSGLGDDSTILPSP